MDKYRLIYMDKDLKIYVITHKNEEGLFKYEPHHQHLFVGADINKCDNNFLKDNTGNNISFLNQVFCELTGLYWVWKNGKKSEYVGFEHYRRHFELSKEEIIDLFVKYDILLPRHDTTLGFGTIYDHYGYCHNSKDMDIISEIINELYPEYNNTYKLVIKGGVNHFTCNSFITSWGNFDKMMTFLFNIFNEFQNRLNLRTVEDFKNHIKTNFSTSNILRREYARRGEDWFTYQLRIMGFLSERLLTLWAFHNFPLGKIGEVKFDNI